MISFHVFQMGLLIILACAVIAPLPGCWRICQRAGFHPALALLVAIPGIGLIALLALLAFADWAGQPAREQ